MVAKVTPCLMFQGDADAAMTFYVSLFPDSEIRHVRRYGPGQAGAEGSVMVAAMSIAGQEVMCIDSAVRHNFTFTPAFSLFVECDSRDEFDRLAAGLGEDGTVLMSPDDYGFSQRFVWLNDRFGVSWQLNLP